MYITRFWGEHHIPPRLRIKSGFYSLKETTTQVSQYYNEQNQQNQLNTRLSRKTKIYKWSISSRRFYSWNRRLRFQILSHIWSVSGIAVRTATIALNDHSTTLPAPNMRGVGGRSPIWTCVHIGSARIVRCRIRFRGILSPIRSNSSWQHTTFDCCKRRNLSIIFSRSSPVTLVTG